MQRISRAAIALSAVLLSGFMCKAAEIKQLTSLKLEVPVPDALFPDGQGADAINANCLVCHSADHVMNQPSLTKEDWKEVVEKMIKGYKAPISEEDASTIVDYLTRIKGKS